jgi:hypothetical protein
MPLARIDVSKNATPELVRIVSDAVYKAMVEVANVPVHDKFQVINRHSADEIKKMYGSISSIRAARIGRSGMAKCNTGRSEQ